MADARAGQLALGRGQPYHDLLAAQEVSTHVALRRGLSRQVEHRGSVANKT